MTAPRVRTGLDVLANHDFAPLRGLTVGLVTHPAAIDARFRHAADLLANAPGVRLATLFGPEHGLLGQAQDLISVRARGEARGPRIVSLYGDTFESLKPSHEHLHGLDTLVIDLQDVGSRYYTFQATMLFCLEAAAEAQLKVFVLDRPNPLGGVEVEGPTVAPGYESFVGVHPIATRHGLTIGELARLYRSERNLNVELEVVLCDGWRRDMYFDDTGLPWVLPSPNMSTLDTALVYPGQCLLEGTNLSEGRGTTRPFELAGFPGLDAHRLASRLNDAQLPGMHFRPAWFQPTFQKHAGQLCGGVQLHVTDRAAFRCVRASLTLLAAMRDFAGDRFDWRREPYEFVANRLAIDLLFGSPRERLALEAGRSPGEISAAWEAEERGFRDRRRTYFLYG
jgi:uncharacterized protein YbbC (DUF1343 family)